MNNMSQIMKQAKAMQEKMTEVQKKIEEMEVEGSSGGGAVKVIMNGRHELKKIDIDKSIINAEESEVLEDLIVAAHNNAKAQLKTKTSEEISKATGEFGIPGFKWPI